MKKPTTYNVVIEKDERGFLIAEVVELPGCFTQAKTKPELLRRIKEAIELYEEAAAVDDKYCHRPSFFGVEKVTI